MKLLKLITVAVMVCIACISCTSQLDQDNSTQLYKNKPIPKIGVQLWSVKDELKADFKGTLTQLADMGFEGVEFAGEFGPYKDDAKGLKAFLDSLGLEARSAHAPFAAFDEEHFDKSVTFYKTLKTETLIIPWDDRGWDGAKVDSLITDLNVLFAKLKAEGFNFGYHNHEGEFDDHKDATFWDHIAKSTPKDFVLQLDVGWITLAEKDPVEYINRYENRTLVTHIKAKLPRDIASKMATNSKRQIVGDDFTDWDAVIKADIMVGGTQWLIIEQEEYPDGLTPLQAVKLSKEGLDKVINNL